MRIVSTIDARQVTHEGVTYESDGEGIFEVPEEVGNYLTSYPVWLTEWQALDLRLAAEREADSDAARLAARVKALEETVAGLTAPRKRAPRKAAAQPDADDASDSDE